MTDIIFRLLSVFLFRIGHCGRRFLSLVLGTLWYRVFRIRRRVVLDNLRIALPEREKEHGHIASDSLTATALTVLEFLASAGAPTPSELPHVAIEGEAHYLSALESGKGVIVVTGHFGNFDLLACSQAIQGVPLAIVSRTMGVHAANNFWMKARTRLGVVVFLEHEVARRGLQWLRANRVLGLVTDQRTPSRRGGIQVPFCGVNAWTSTLAARLVLRTGAALLPVFIERQPNGTHLARIAPPLAVPDSGSTEERIRFITVSINEHLEKQLRSHPEDWLWIHRRFDNCC